MYNSNENEKEILKYWDDNHCFERSVNERPENKPYHFFDGPPFATGLPHYGHIVASLMKDAVPRYWTMQGFRVDRKWGWDCHGLPIENIIEKDLNLNSKKAIEDYGVPKFNEACRSTVLKYAEEWKKTIKRMGRWVDMEHDYKTMDLNYMESVWWVFGELWKKNLIYKGHKAMHICPRCVTPLSNFEVTQGYKDVKDLSVTAKFKIKNPEKNNLPENTFVLAWTTTPWTFPGNVLLAIGNKLEYVVVNSENENFILAAERIESVLKDKKYTIVKNIPGSELVGLEYEPLFPYFKDTAKAFRVVSAEFVTVENGTGVVHIAPAFGTDDYELGKLEGLELVQHVGMDGRFVAEVVDFAGQEVKPKEDPSATDLAVLKWLASAGKLFSKEKFEHSYPHCWRCDSPLLNYATTCWFVRVTDLKEQLLDNNKKINWVPAHIKDGRFGLWLEGARDWAISRNRFWGTPLPVWENDAGHALCVNSVAELEKLSGQKITDLHKHLIDNVEIVKDGVVYRRIPEVLDCWFESGAMPYGQMHYPFENKDKFEFGFPAEFIAEGQDQTRGWFYTLHVLATALTESTKRSIPTTEPVPAFKNVIVNGIVLAEDGKKMSKRLKNYPEPDILLEKYGADAMRYYLITSPVMEAENLNFSETGVREVYSKLINTVWNVVEFYKMYAGELKEVGESQNILDQWVVARLNETVATVTKGMNEYRLVDASRPVLEFITDLSQWYVRRSRDRFKGEDMVDKTMAVSTLRTVLLTLSKIMAPFTPFIAEKIYQEVGAGENGSSVHLEMWPKIEAVNKEVLNKMTEVRKLVEMGLSLRAEAGVKVKQPLSKFAISAELDDSYRQIIADELNVKEVVQYQDIADENWKHKEDLNQKTALFILITAELKKEGLMREVIRTINQMRKEQEMTITDYVEVAWQTEDVLLKSVFVDYASNIKSAVLAANLVTGGQTECMIDGKKLNLSVVKI